MTGYTKRSNSFSELFQRTKSILSFVFILGIIMLGALGVYSALLNSDNISFKQEIKKLKNQNEKLSLKLEKIKGSYSLSEKAKSLGMVEAENVDYLVSKKASSFALK